MSTNGIGLQLTHTGLSGRASIHLSDLENRPNLPAMVRNATPTYIPYLGTAVLAYGGDVVSAFEAGSIRKFVDEGYLTAVFVFGSPFEAALPESTFSTVEKSNLEMEMAFKAAQLNTHKVFTYTGDLLTLIRIYDDALLTTHLFTKALTYTGDVLTSALTTRISDGAGLLKSFTYTGDQLTASTQVAVP